MKAIPDSIKRYLETLDGDFRPDGYLRIDDSLHISRSDGWVGNTNLSAVDQSQNPVLAIPILEGLLPGNPNAPTVITHAHIDKDYYFDIHLFHDAAGAWVLFIDKTRSAKLLQQEQQIRLNDDFNNEKRRQSN